MLSLILFITFRLLFSGQELSEIISDLRDADMKWVAVGAAMSFATVAGEAVIIRYLLKKLGQRRRFHKCLKYSFIGFFFSFITPSASGGQPAQMYYMKKDDLSIGYSTLIMLLITIAYKSVLIILGGVSLLFFHSTLSSYTDDFTWLIVLGFALNILFIAALMVIFHRPVWARKIGIKLINLLVKIHIIRPNNRTKYREKVIHICDTYAMGADYVKKNRSVVLKVFVLTALQRLSLFLVTWCVYRSYGLNGLDVFEITALQIIIGVAVEMLPLPGAAGISEGCFLLTFTKVFGEELVRPALLISRGLSYYLILITGGIVTFAAHTMLSFRDKRSEMPHE